MRFPNKNLNFLFFLRISWLALITSNLSFYASQQSHMGKQHWMRVHELNLQKIYRIILCIYSIVDCASRLVSRANGDIVISCVPPCLSIWYVSWASSCVMWTAMLSRDLWRKSIMQSWPAKCSWELFDMVVYIVGLSVISHHRVLQLYSILNHLPSGNWSTVMESGDRWGKWRCGGTRRWIDGLIGSSWLVGGWTVRLG